jgi:hypothetical protein
LAQAGQSLSTSPVDQEISLSLRDGAWLGLRNAAAVTVVMIGLRILVSSLGGRDRGSQRVPAWEFQDEGDADPRG